MPISMEKGGSGSETSSKYGRVHPDLIEYDGHVVGQVVPHVEQGRQQEQAGIDVAAHGRDY